MKHVRKYNPEYRIFIKIGKTQRKHGHIQIKKKTSTLQCLSYYFPDRLTIDLFYDDTL